MGHLIPAGTGLKKFKNIIVMPAEESVQSDALSNLLVEEEEKKKSRKKEKVVSS